MREARVRPLHLLVALIVLAAALRFWRIGHQSFWLDEAFTVDLARRDFGGMLDGVRHTESTPPLYYVLAWGWSRVFGHGEAGLRSLSALAGIAAVPLAYLTARRAFGVRAGLITAALVAVNPYLCWYSQEARAYSLLVVTGAASLLFFVSALQEPERGRWLALWAAAAGAALLSHYFAAFLVAPEAAWLVYRLRSRAAVLALGPVTAVGLALVPLAIAQRDTGHTDFISRLSFTRRVVDLPKKAVTGELGTPTDYIGPAAGLLLVLGCALALLAQAPPARRRAATLLSLTAAAVAIPLVLRAAGLDYFFPRNLIEALLPLLVVAGAGFASTRTGVLGPLAAAGVCAVAIAVVIQVGVNSSVQRDDWRGAAAGLGPPHAPRALVVSTYSKLTPDVVARPLRLYVRGLSLLPEQGASVGEVDVLVNARPPRFAPAPAPGPSFRLVGRLRSQSFELDRFRAVAPVALSAAQLAAVHLGPNAPALFLQRP